jgi:hypothetical protein
MTPQMSRAPRAATGTEHRSLAGGLAGWRRLTGRLCDGSHMQAARILGRNWLFTGGNTVPRYVLQVGISVLVPDSTLRKCSRILYPSSHIYVKAGTRAAALRA